LKVLITGGGGFLGVRLAKALLAHGSLARPTGGRADISELLVSDVSMPRTPLPEDRRLKVEIVDVNDAHGMLNLIRARPDVIFHLAAVVSAAAEADFELGMRVNLHGTLNLLEVCRRLVHCPRLVFASSVAVYGGDLPSVVADDTALAPQSSYGAQKAIGELLVDDYSRKGFIDGRALRLPTIVVRVGAPNLAASSFASAIIREPLHGEEAVCPVPPHTQMWLMSSRRAIENLILAAELPAEAFAASRSVALPGLSVSIADMVESLRRVAGDAAAARIRWQRDPAIERIVGSWPARFAPQRAQALGFTADRSIDEIIRAFINDELGGTYVV
jgi:nucleoside-diphosphate-sugar epimerase